MRTLFTFDKHNYSDDLEVFERFSVRTIIIRDGKLAMQQAGEDFYLILGCGIEVALARDVREEAGLLVVPESIRECGKVIEKRRDIFEADKIYYCHTYVYFCDVKDEHVAAQMTDSEIRLEYHLSWATPDEIIKANSTFLDKEWIARDTKIVELIKEMC